MPTITSSTGRLQQAGLSPGRLEQLYDYVGAPVEDGRLPGACVLVARHGQAVSPHAFGLLRPGVDDRPIRPDTIFLVASITKPVTVAAAMLLVERGQLLLDDRVSMYIPEFGTNGKEEIRIRHLMTHTSGLPDFLPENFELRRQHAPLEEFIRRICKLTPDFAPGTNVQYQSTGLGMLGAVVEAIAGVPLPEFLHREFFLPLGMADTALGLRHLDPERIAFVDVPNEMRGEDWGWNTSYWWNLAVPWGGMFTTARDLFRFFQMFLNHGEYAGVRILSSATVAAMTSNQLVPLPDLPDAVRRKEHWGLGWGLAGRRTGSGWSYFGDLASPKTFGHGGATGTLAWADPARELVCILFTTQPRAMQMGVLSRASNIAAACANSSAATNT
jgi:CubicO group peptidase (beta-lactamase class C family)